MTTPMHEAHLSNGDVVVRRARSILRPITPILSVIVLLTAQLTAWAAVFTEGDVFVYRVGDGLSVLSGAAAPVFLDEYDVFGQMVRSIALPTADNGSNQTLTAAGSATSEGLLTLSLDGSAILLTGYDASPGTLSVSGTNAATVNRVVGFIDPAGNVDTTTALSDFASLSNPRGVASTNGLDLWVAGATGGVRYTTRGSTNSTQLSTTSTNLRGVEIFGGQLYVSTGSGSLRLATVGTGLPTMSGQTITQLPGIPITDSPYQFALFDLSAAVAGYDTLYLADEASTTGLLKYSFDGTTWNANGNIAVAGNAFRGLSAYDTGNGIQLFLSSPTALFTFLDTTGFNGILAGSTTTIVTASSNTAFRGVAVIPVPEPSSLAVLVFATGALVFRLPRGKAAVLG